MPDSNLPNTYYWMFSIFALIWNLMGVFQFYSIVTITPEAIAALPEAEQSLYADVPTWVTIAMGLAVFGGTFGCMALLWKKAFAYYLFIISLVGIIPQMYHNLFMSDMMAVYGPGGATMPVMIIIIAVGLLWMTQKAKQKGWLA